MEKRYREIVCSLGENLEGTVKVLLEYKEKGIPVYTEFNGTKLYSDTVTLDSAYQQVIGKTKKEFDEEKEREFQEYSRKRKEHKEKIPALEKEWMEKGRTILTEDKWAFWDEIVPVRLNDLYRGMELGCSLDIITILNNGGTLEEAKKKIESQNHSGTSFGLVCAMVKEFSVRGEEFAKYVD